MLKNNLERISNLNVIHVTLLLFQILSLFFLKFNFLAIAISLPVIFLRYHFFENYQPQKKLAFFILLCFIELPFIFYPSAYNIFGGIRPHSLSEITNLFILGNILLILHFLINIALSRRFNFSEKKSFKEYCFKFRNYKILWWIVFITAFLSSIISFKLGVGVMGKKAPDLPFKIESILNHFRNTAIPFLAITLLDIFYKKRSTRWVILTGFLYFCWLSFETYIRASRGVFFVSGISIIIWALTCELINLKKASKIVIPLVTILVIMYPFISSYRELKIKQPHYSAADIYKEGIVKVTSSTTPIFFELYNRIFGAGEEVLKFTPFLKSTIYGGIWSDIVEVGGSSHYHTYKVDKVAKHVVHSSGVTGLADGFLCLGYIGLFLTLFIFSTSTFFIDLGALGFITSTSAGKSMISLYLALILFSGQGFINMFFYNILYNCVWPLLFLFTHLLTKRIKLFI
ncbi:hypothetical protein A9Q84_05120 [Halobacteriovorax marinus]|mgnify:CR=1 FL=1|uniref:Oligosaccharide repeat unit polymerase n=1 Tax=Halobacteriovorax marinus TaxID=97084 RepID=A0A1Y5FB17_9BACT|nr:hypothetical protein A9Q84_05120 [Halobacteriovorax marinus]